MTYKGMCHGWLYVYSLLVMYSCLGWVFICMDGSDGKFSGSGIKARRSRRDGGPLVGDSSCNDVN